MPLKPYIIKDISEYLAGRFDSDYKFSALYELTNDVRLQSNMSETALAGIIYDWLMAPDGAPENQTERFISQFGNFSSQKLQEIITNPEDIKPALGASEFAIYYQNEGKRQAARDFMNCILALEKPCTVRVFTDEEM